MQLSRDGRPGSQQVTEEFLVDWGSYMSSRNDVVYVKLDVAGARGLPRALLRGRLGGVEVADQLAVIRYVKLRRSGSGVAIARHHVVREALRRGHCSAAASGESK